MSTSSGSLLRSRKQTRTLSITSGKGGVGKTSITSNLAVSLAAQGQRVLILDGDMGLANVDVMFGIRTTHNIQHVLSGERELKDIIVEVAQDVFLIPGGSGIYGLHNLSIFQKKTILDQVNDLPGGFDFMLIDTASGIDDTVLYLNAAAQETLVVVTCEPASMTDAYALIKVMNRKYGEHKFSIVVNMAQDEAEAKAVYSRLSEVASRFLTVSLDYKGYLPNDQNLRFATKSQQLVTLVEPRTPVSYAIRGLAEKLNGYGNMARAKGGMQFFWEQLVGVA